MQKVKQKGFTLLELMIVIAILGVLAAIAYPSFESTLAKNRARSAEAQVNKALAYGRSEAISRNAQIGICPLASADTDQCAPSANACIGQVTSKDGGCAWSNGILVYVDKNLNFDFDAQDEVISHFYINEHPIYIGMKNNSNDIAALTWRAGGMLLNYKKDNAQTAQEKHLPITGINLTIVPNNDKTKGNQTTCSIATTGRLLCAIKK